MFPAPSFAQDAVDIQVRSHLLAGQGQPALLVAALSEVRDLRISVRRADGAVQVFKAARLLAGQTREFPIKHGVGQADYVAEVRYAGIKNPYSIDFQVVVARPMEIRISRDTVDLAEGTFSFVATETVSKVTVSVFGNGGDLLGEYPFDVKSPAGTTTTVRIPSAREAVTRVRLTAYDPYGFFNGIEMTPFFVEVPHEEVNFEFGKAEIPPEEAPKLARTLDRVHEALARLGNEFQARLYVAGYTDTVGSREYNQDLSERRAMSIARWFHAHGLKVRACAQGFGEDAPAVPTPDETPEPRNRRSLHVLANQPPPVSAPFPRQNWKCL
jgi:outer membrane protein OmpA-like peptidoglycan-associated protein